MITVGHRIWEWIAAVFSHAPDTIAGKWSLAGSVGIAWGVVALAFMLRAGTHVTERERDGQYAFEYR
ncbi:MAG: hypothetical protein ABW067_06080, partial [Rhizobacter sp.]